MVKMTSLNSQCLAAAIYNYLKCFKNLTAYNVSLYSSTYLNLGPPGPGEKRDGDLQGAPTSRLHKTGFPVGPQEARQEQVPLTRPTRGRREEEAEAFLINSPSVCGQGSSQESRVGQQCGIL